MNEYIHQLRHNREFRATELLKSSLDNQGVKVKTLGGNFLKEIALLQNRTRGPLFELMAEVMIVKAFNLSEFNRQAVFITPFGVRRFDLYVKSGGIAFEVKSGYARLRSFTRKQIQKDRYLLENDETVKRVIWVCFRGATAPLLNALMGSGPEPNIECFDIAIDQMEADYDKDRQVIRI